MTRSPALKAVALLLCTALLHASAAPAFAQLASAAASRTGTAAAAVVPVQSVQLGLTPGGDLLRQQELAGTVLPALTPLLKISPVDDAASVEHARSPVGMLQDSAVPAKESVAAVPIKAFNGPQGKSAEPVASADAQGHDVAAQSEVAVKDAKDVVDSPAGEEASRGVFARLKTYFNHEPARFWDNGTKAPSSDGAAAPPAGAVERLERGERTFAPEPESFELDESTLNDLQVFTAGGLRSQLDKTRTLYGFRRLAGLLQRPYLDAGEIGRRQEAVKAIVSDEGLRTRLQEAFKRLDKSADKGLDDHFKTLEGLFGPFVMLGVLFGCILPGSWILGGWPLLLQTAPTYIILIGSMLTQLTQFRQKLLRYKAVFRFARDLAEPLAKSSSPALRELGGVFSAVSDKRHPLGLTKLAGSLGRMLPLPLAVLLDALFVWGTKTLWHPVRLLRKSKERVAQLFGALGELDVYLTFAELLASGEPWTLPSIEAGAAARLSIEGGHHPIVLALRGKDSTPNDAELGPGKSFSVLTGTNMGGKSTYLRMVALLTLLAQIGAPVPARAMSLTPLELLTSVDVGDDLRAGKSLYDAETDRLLKIVDGARTSKRVLAVMDEILQGTNPEERTAAERAVVRYLADTPNLFLVATHNLSIAEVAAEAASLRNFHVAGEADAGASRYRVLPGPAKDRNGILTLERKGFPEELVRDARSRLEQP